MWLLMVSSLIFHSITTLVTAHPQWHGRDEKSGPAPVGGAIVCTGPDFTGNCYTAPDCVGHCYVWTATWEWADSFDADSDFRCSLQSSVPTNDHHNKHGAVG